MKKSWLFWTLRVIAAGILIQTLFFKFTAAPESVALFRDLGAEPAGRIGSGVLEAVTAILLLTPRFSGWGALLGLGMMSGAILSHIFVLGFADGRGSLFVMGLVVWASCLSLLLHHRDQIPILRNSIDRSATT